MAGAISALLLAGGLAACTPDLPDVPRSNDLLDASDALLDMPVGGPEIVAVIDQSGELRRSQRILLATSSRTYGQNSFEIRVASLSLDVGPEGEGPAIGVTPTMIRAELRNLFPTIPMGVSNLYVQNDYGPFGYAIGRADTGDTCLYAWQVIRGERRVLTTVADGVVSLRLRLCDYRASDDDLLAVMYGFTLKASVPVTPPLVRPELGRTGAPVFAVPVGAAPPPATNIGIGRAPEPVALMPRVVRPAPTPAPPPPVVPLPGYPTVPLPPGTTVSGGSGTPAAIPSGIIVPLPPP